MDDLSPRQQALLDYIHIYMTNKAGRPPTIREMLEARVGKFTRAGVITSTSVMRHNLNKLEKAGRVVLAKDGSARNIAVPGASFGIAWNVIHSIPIEKYPTRIVGIDYYFGQFTKIARKIFYSWYVDPDVSVYTFTLRKFGTNLWDDIGYSAGHEMFDFAYQVFANFVFQYGIPANEIAVITQDHFERLAAVGFGMAVFDPEKVFDA